MLLNKVGEGKNELRDSNSQLKLRVSDLRAAMCALKESVRMKLLKSKHRSSSCDWLDYNASWTLGLTGICCSSEGVDWEG